MRLIENSKKSLLLWYGSAFDLQAQYAGVFVNRRIG